VLSWLSSRVWCGPFLLLLTTPLVSCGGGRTSTVPLPGDFTLSVTPGSVSTTVGSTSAPLTLTVNPLNGYTGSVTVAISGAPNGITSSPASPFSVGVGSSQQVTFSAPAAAGTFAITLTATSSPLVHTATATLTVAAAANPFIVAAAYYPWYTGDWWTPDGCYNGLMRNELAPPQTPMLGQYDSTNQDVITQHIAWSTGAGVNTWAVEWIQPHDFIDSTLHDQILANQHISDIRFALFYDLAIRFQVDFNLTQDKIDAVVADFGYMAQTYFSNPQYLKVGNRPVVFLYFTSAFNPVSAVQQMGTSIRAAMNQAGFDVFMIGDEYYPGYVLPDAARIGIWDGIFGYGANLNYSGYSDDNGLLAFHATSQARFAAVAQSLGVDFIPGVTPGFNDKGVRRTCQSSPVLARRTSATAQEGSLFEKWLTTLTLPYAANSRSKIMYITTWNEWHEDTAIEPSLVTSATTTDTSASGTEFTQGFVYQGYGTTYLDILRNAIAATQVPAPQNRNLGHYATFADLTKQHPELQQAGVSIPQLLAQGKIRAIVTTEGGKSTGIQVYEVNPDWEKQKTSNPVTIKIPSGLDEKGQTKFETQDIPAGAISLLRCLHKCS
jgi:glycoprotein endo-alpha-1,2-mannosidase